MAEKTKSSTRRKLVIAAGSLVALLLIAVLLLPLLIDVNQYRGLIEDEARKALGREVTLGDLSLSLLPTFGIEVRPIAVEGIVRAEGLTIGARLLPLIFGGDIEISKIILDAPEFTLSQEKDGSWNVASLTSSGEHRTPSPDVPSTPRGFSLANLVISQGVVRLRTEERNLDFSLDLSGSLGMSAEGVIDAAFSGRVGSGDILLAIDSEVRARDSGSLVENARIALVSGDSQVTLSGSIDNRGEGTLVDVVVPSSAVAADDLRKILAVAGIELPFTFEARRPMSLEARVKGDVITGKSLVVDGRLEVSEATFMHPAMSGPMTDISGEVAVGNDRFEVTGLSAIVGESDINGRIKVTGFDKPDVEFALKSKRADFMELMSFLKEDASPSSGAGTTAGGGGGDETDLIGLISGQGTLAIGKGSFGSLAFSDLDSTLSLKGRLLRLEPVRMVLYGGPVSGKATLDLTTDPPVYSVEGELQKVDAGAMLNANLDLGNMLTGRLSGEVALTASGTSVDDVLNRARGTGSIRATDGRVGAVNVLGMLSQASGLLGEQSLQQVSARLATEGTDFSTLSGTLRVADGSIRTRDFRMVSPDLELAGEGALNMLEATLVIAGRIVFSDAVSKSMQAEKSRAADYFWDTSTRRVSVPLVIEGPVDAPIPNIDWNAAAGQLAKSKLQEQLDKKGLGSILGGGQKAPADNTALKASLPPETTPSEAGGLDVMIRRKEFSGNFLVPDLKIRGTLLGRNITAADLQVIDHQGNVLFNESLMGQVRSYYGSTDPSRNASIEFRIDVDGKHLARTGGAVLFTITLEDKEGHRALRRFEASR